MQSLVGGAIRSARLKISVLSSVRAGFGSGNGGFSLGISPPDCFASSLHSMPAVRTGLSQILRFCDNQFPSQLNKKVGANVPQCASSLICFSQRTMSTISENAPDPALLAAPRIKFKRLDKTARNIMQILDREAVAEVKSQREVPDIKPGYIIQMKVVSPENKRRVTTIKGIVIARRNAGLNTTFRVRRLVAGVGVESLFPLYSPNIKEVKVLDKKKVRRAKLYYLREKMNPLKK